MQPADVTQTFIELCERSGSSIDCLAAGFRNAVGELGFPYFAFCSRVDPLHPPSAAIMMHNYPAGWARCFSEEKLYEIDPVLKRAERSRSPFHWDTAFRAEPITPEQKAILSEAAAFGLAHGFTIPINLPWLPGMLRASCSVVPDSSTIGQDSYLLVQLMAFHLYTSVTTGYAPWPEVMRAGLTNRERQCLILAARGKSDKEIGNELGLSGTTAHTFIEHCKQRFGVDKRIAAVMSAVMSGEILLRDVAVIRRSSLTRYPSSN